MTIPRYFGRDVVPHWARLWFADASLLVVTQALTMVATSASAILIARQLRPEQWGVFSAFLGVSIGIGVIGEFGLVTWSLRELSRLFAERGDSAQTEARTLVVAALTIPTSASIATLLIAVIVTSVRGDGAAVVIALACLLGYAGLFSAANVLESYLRARRMIGRLVRASILEKFVLIVAIVVTTVGLGWGIIGVGASYLLAGSVRFIFLVGPVFSRLENILCPNWHDIRRIARSSLPFALTASAMTIPKLDTFALLTLSAPAAGYFALGDRLLTPAAVLPAILSATLFPFLASQVRRPTVIAKLAVVLGIGGAVIAVAGIALAPELVPMLFGRKYQPAIPAVQVLLVTLPIVFAASPLLAFGYARGQERSIFRLSLASSLLGTAAIVCGQMLGGVTIAAVGAIIRQALLLGGLAFISARTKHIRPSERFSSEPIAPSPQTSIT